MGELVKALLDLFTQSVDQSFHFLTVGAGDRTHPAIIDGSRCRAGSGYFQSERQKPARPRPRPTATLRARRTIRRGLPEAAALMLFEILAAR